MALPVHHLVYKTSLQAHRSAGKEVRRVKQEIPVQAWTGSEGTRFHDNGHMKVVRLSDLCTGRLYPQEMSIVLIPARG